MKKFFAILLAAVLCVAVSATAFAASYTGDKTGMVVGDTDSKDVQIKFANSKADKATYSVDVAWDDLSFTYTVPTGATWDASTLTYVGAYWDKTNANVSVTNNSDSVIKASLAFAGGSRSETKKGANIVLTGLDGTSINSQLQVISGFKGTESFAPADTKAARTAVGTITVSGDGSAWGSSFATFDTAVVTIAAA